ncbi:MAG: ATP-binding protein [Candidatus Pacearchaeota archaeon]|jgi:predicted ATPase
MDNKKGDRKFVLTGGASCGKTTLLGELRRRGYQVIEEAATDILEDRADRIVNSEEIELRQKLIFRRSLRRENYDFGSNMVFFDRGLVDCLVYSQYYLGRIPDEIKNFDCSKRYDDIFVLDRLNFEKNHVRIEKDNDEAEKIHQLIIEYYKINGYNPIFVPLMKVEERAYFILNYLKGGEI